MSSVSASDGVKKRRRTEKEISFLDIFTQLTAWQKEARLRAAITLLQRLHDASPDARASEVSYSIQRLTRGLASNHEGARQGFATALSLVLEAFGSDEAVQQVLEEVQERMTPVGSTGGDEEKQMYFGRVFAVSCLLRSGRIAGLASREEREQTLVLCASLMLQTMREKSYLPELCSQTLIEVIEAVGGEDRFRLVLLPVILPFLEEHASEECSPEALAVLLVLQKRHHFEVRAELANSRWQRNDLLHYDNVALVGEALRASSASHPGIHMVWSHVLQDVFEENHTAQRVETFWRTVVDGILFASHVDNRKFLGFVLLSEFVARCKDAKQVVTFFGAPHTLRSLINHATNPKAKMHMICLQPIRALLKRGAQDSSFASAVLASFAEHPKLRNFDVITRTNTMRHLIAALDNNSSTDAWFASMRDALLDPATRLAGRTAKDEEAHATASNAASLSREQQRQISLTRKRALDQLGAWVKTSKQDESPTTHKALESVLQLFAWLTLEAHDAPSSSDAPFAPPAPPLTSQERRDALSRFLALLGELDGADRGYTHRWSQKIVAWWEALQPGRVEGLKAALTELRRCAKRTKKDAANARYYAAFARTLAAVAVLACTVDNFEAALLEDALEACKSFRSALKEEDVEQRHKAVLVLLSVMIQLLTSNNSFYRAAVNGSFRALVPMIPATGVKDIVDAIVSKEGEETAQGEEDDDSEDDDDADDDDSAAEEDELASGASSASVLEVENLPSQSSSSSSDDDDGEGLESIPLDSATPEYLKLVEDKLAEVFSIMKTAKAKKRDQIKAAREFKLRVLDLLDLYVRGQARMATLPAVVGVQSGGAVFTVILPLLKKLKRLEHQASQVTMYEKLRRIVVDRLCRLSKWPSVKERGGKTAIAELNNTLLRVVGMATRGNPTKLFLGALTATISFVARALLKEGEALATATIKRSKGKKKENGEDKAHAVVGCLDLTRFRGATQKLYSYYGNKKNLNNVNQTTFFAQLWARVPALGLYTLPQLAKAIADPKCVEAVRTKYVLLVPKLVFGAHAKGFVSQNPHVFAEAIAAVERCVLGWLLAQVHPKQKKATRSATLGSVLQDFTDLLLMLASPKYGRGEFKRSNLGTAVNGQHIATAVDNVLKRWKNLASSTRLRQLRNKLFKLIGVSPQEQHATLKDTELKESAASDGAATSSDAQKEKSAGKGKKATGEAEANEDEDKKKKKDVNSDNNDHDDDGENDKKNSKKSKKDKKQSTKGKKKKRKK